MSEHLKNWVIYERPVEYPDHFVIRLWLVVNGRLVLTPVQKFAKTLQEARKAIPPGLICFRRDASDVPELVETWM
ncbi:hypothetical protein D3C87_1700750 [compost metagenome]